MASLKKTAGQTLIIDESEGSSDESGEPRAKVSKICDSEEEITERVPIKLRENLKDTDFMNLFQKNWTEEQSFTNNSFDTILYNDPFKLCTIQNFLGDPQVIRELSKEMLDVEWSRKVMDLYEFFQSTDLSNIQSPYLSAFFEMLHLDVMPWIEKVCNIKLSNVSASCSMYNCGDYLLVHDDLLSDRQIAFVFYLSPWENVDTWTENMGGCLELFSTDSNGMPQFPIVNKISPKNNQFVFFKVDSRSFHQVGEVTNFDYPRLTINGWFHGENNNTRANKLSAAKIFTPPISNDLELSSWIKSTYLQESTKQDIQKVIEDKSEICLDNFFLQTAYEDVTKELISDESFQWILKGPANCACYEVLDLTSTQGLSKDFFALFTSKKMFKLLYEYTDLDLYGPNAKDPMCSLEVQRWRHGSYTILGASSPDEKNVLDVVLYLNPSDHVGEITYLTLEPIEDDEESDSESDPVLLTLSPKYNALNIVYPSEGASRFTKYVSKKTKISNEFVYIIVCSYKE